MKHFLTPTSLALLAMLSSSTQAALVFNIANISDDVTATTSAAAGVGVTATVAHSVTQGSGESNYEGLGNGGTLGIITITVSGMTVDAVGSGDDVAVMRFSVDSGGNTIDDASGTSGWGVNGNGAGRLSATSESLIIRYISGTATLGAGATEAGDVQFKGFNRVRFLQFDADGGASDDVATLSFEGGSTTNVLTDDHSFTSNPANMTIGYLTGDDGNDGFKLDTFQARFEVGTVAVPEPSSTLLFGFGAMTLILRRKK